MTYYIWQTEQFYGGIGRDYDPEAEGGWRMVWNGTIDEPATAGEVNGTLEVLFARFQRVDENMMPPLGYTGRSMTAGDLVELDGRYFYCDTVGWKQVDQRPLVFSTICVANDYYHTMHCPRCGGDVVYRSGPHAEGAESVRCVGCHWKGWTSAEEREAFTAA